MNDKLFKSNYSNEDKYNFKNIKNYKNVSININILANQYKDFNINNLLDVLFIQHLYYFNINIEIKNFLDNLINEYSNKILIYSFSKDELIYIMNELCNLSEDIVCNRISQIFNILFENIKKVEFNDCLINELLNLSEIINNKPIVYTIQKLSKLINLDKKSLLF